MPLTHKVIKFVCHSKRVIRLAGLLGWLPGARYTNLRDVRGLSRIGFLDIDWKRYCFDSHLAAAKATKPLITVARDIEAMKDVRKSLSEAALLKKHCKNVIIVPKAMELEPRIDDWIPTDFILGYSVPTKYGGTKLATAAFGNRAVHLLGGRPDQQFRLSRGMNVVSLDCNRFTIDAAFGDYFDGSSFRPHPMGGYERCIFDSIRNINKLWEAKE